MNGDDFFELYRLFKDFQERAAELRPLCEDERCDPDLMLVIQAKIKTLEFDLRAQADKYLELYQKF